MSSTIAGLPAFCGLAAIVCFAFALIAFIAEAWNSAVRRGSGR